MHSRIALIIATLLIVTHLADTAQAKTWGRPASRSEVSKIIKRVLYVRPDNIPRVRPRLKPNRKLMSKSTADAIDTLESMRPGRVPTRAERPNAIHGARGLGSGLMKPNYKYATGRQLLAELYQPGQLRVDQRSGEVRWLVKGAKPLRLGKLAGASKRFFALSPQARNLRNERVGEAMLAARQEQVRPTGTYKDRYGYTRRKRATAAVPRGGRETLPDGTKVTKSAGVWYSDNGRGPFFGDGNPAETVSSSARYRGLLPTVITAFSQARTPSKTHHNNGATAVMLGNMYPYTLKWTKNGVAKSVSFTNGYDKWMVVKEKPVTPAQ